MRANLEKWHIWYTKKEKKKNKTFMWFFTLQNGFWFLKCCFKVCLEWLKSIQEPRYNVSSQKSEYSSITFISLGEELMLDSFVLVLGLGLLKHFVKPNERSERAWHREEEVMGEGERKAKWAFSRWCELPFTPDRFPDPIMARARVSWCKFSVALVSAAHAPAA